MNAFEPVRSRVKSACDLDLTATSTPFEFTTFFMGRTTAWGVVEDRFGRLRRRFSVEMQGAWHDSVFHLDERFVHDTGEIESRCWKIVHQTGSVFTATCDDCIGQATGGSALSVIRMTYKFRLKLKSRVLVVDFDDRLYRLSATTAVNRATMSKFGIKVGEISIFMTRHGAITPPS